MKKEHINILIGSVSLIIGGFLYVLFRENTYIGKLFSVPIVIAFRKQFAHVSSDFLRYYLPDFLWGFAFGHGLQAILGSSKTNSILCSCAVFLSGVLWEALQACSIIHGTGDLWDVVAYFLASALCVIPNYKERKQ